MAKKKPEPDRSPGELALAAAQDGWPTAVRFGLLYVATSRLFWMAMASLISGQRVAELAQSAF